MLCWFILVHTSHLTPHCVVSESVESGPDDFSTCFHQGFHGVHTVGYHFGCSAYHMEFGGVANGLEGFIVGGFGRPLHDGI